MSLEVTTESGAVYEFRNGLSEVRRRGDHSDTEMRKDGIWVACEAMEVQIGRPMVLMLDGVAPVGPTLRTTTPVLSIAYLDD